MKNILDQEQAKEFDVYVDEWQTILNVHDWRIERGNRPAKNAMASVEMDDGPRLAVLRLGDFAGTPINSQSLSMTALHEVLHVFLYDLIQTARSNNEAGIEAEEHRVINVLEKLLGKAWQKHS
jgi:hypothetical protein